jgi:hypothetical protein
MATEITLEELHAMALRGGLNLADEELRKLLVGVNRSRRQASELRDLLADGSEPAATFTAADTRMR